MITRLKFGKIIKMTGNVTQLYLDTIVRFGVLILKVDYHIIRDLVLIIIFYVFVVQYVLVSSSDDQTIRIWQRELVAQDQLNVMPILVSSEETWVQKTVLPKVHIGAIYSVSWSKTSGKVVSCGSDGNLVVYKEDEKHWIIEALQKHAHDVYELNCSIFGNISDTEYIFTGGDDANINIWELKSTNS